MFIKNQNQNFNYQRYYPSSKRGLPSLKKLCIILILIIIIIFIVVMIFKSKKKNNNEDSLNKKINEIKAINEKLKNDINTLNSEISELNKKSTELKENKEKLQKEQDNNKEKENSELSEIDNKLSSIENEYNDIEEKTKTLKTDIEKIEKENNEAEDKIKELKSKLESLEKEKENKVPKTSTLADTVILTDDNIKSILNSFDIKLDLNLLYRASKHGKNISDLKENVGKHKNILIVGKTSDDLIIGGYTTSNLEGSGFKEDKYAFLYNFKNGKKFKIKKEKEALKLKEGEFPSFGDGDITFGPYKIQSKFPTSYKGEYLELTGGKSEVNFDDIEVFYLSKKK